MKYRHHEAKVDQVIKDYSQCLKQLFNEKKTFYIFSNINININERSSQVVNYLNATESNGAFQLITKPTRVTSWLGNKLKGYHSYWSHNHQWYNS